MILLSVDYGSALLTFLRRCWWRWALVHAKLKHPVLLDRHNSQCSGDALKFGSCLKAQITGMLSNLHSSSTGQKSNLKHACNWAAAKALLIQNRREKNGNIAGHGSANPCLSIYPLWSTSLNWFRYFGPSVCHAQCHVSASNINDLWAYLQQAASCSCRQCNGNK